MRAGGRLEVRAGVDGWRMESVGGRWKLDKALRIQICQKSRKMDTLSINLLFTCSLQ